MKFLFEEGIAGEYRFHRVYKHVDTAIGIWVQDTDNNSECCRKVVVALFSNTNMKWENLKTENFVKIDRIEGAIEKLLRYVKYIID